MITVHFRSLLIGIAIALGAFLVMGSGALDRFNNFPADHQYLQLILKDLDGDIRNVSSNLSSQVQRLERSDQRLEGLVDDEIEYLGKQFKKDIKELTNKEIAPLKKKVKDHNKLLAKIMDLDIIKEAIKEYDERKAEEAAKAAAEAAKKEFKR